MSRSRNSATSAVTATSRFGGLPVRRRRSATVIPVVSSPPRLDVHVQRLGRDQAAVERRRDRQRIVDERAVEAVVRGVELHVEAERVGDVRGRSGCWPRTGWRASGPRRAPGRWNRRACCRPAGRAGRRRRAGSVARSVTSRPSASGRGIDGSASRRVGPGPEHDLGGVGVAVDVPLGGRCRVARTRRTRRPSGCSRAGAAGSPGSRRTARARLVSGPSVTRVISPGRRCASSRMRSTA